MSYKLVLSTCPDLPTAHLIAEGLITNDLAACVNILPNVVSVYKWQGELEQSCEVKLFIKTDETKWPLVESFITKQHPYDVPEVLCVDIAAGNQDYLEWLSTSLNPN